jgi:hypothetical protein
VTDRRDSDGNESVAQWRAHWKRLRQADRDAIPDQLGPPEAFSARRGSASERAEHGHFVPDEETGPRSRAVSRRLNMSCAGWRKTPSAEEFYNALHAPGGTDREAAILLTWYHEADAVEQLDARLEEAYSWRDLVQAFHRVGLIHGEAARQINWFSER